MFRTRLNINGIFTDAEGGGHCPAIDRAVLAAHHAFYTGNWPRIDGRARAAILRRIAGSIRTRLSDIAFFDARGSGKPMPEAEWDIGDAACCFATKQTARYDHREHWGWRLDAPE